MGAPNLTNAEKHLYCTLWRLAKERAPTPHYPALAEMLTAAGYPCVTKSIYRMVRTLVAAQYIDTVDLGSPKRGKYIIRGHGAPLSTMSGDEAEALRAREAIADGGSGISVRGGWPRPTVVSAACYDDAVARREFAKHESGERPGPVVHVRAPYGAHSLTGCSAADCAQFGSKRDRRAA